MNYQLCERCTKYVAQFVKGDRIVCIKCAWELDRKELTWYAQTIKETLEDVQATALRMAACYEAAHYEELTRRLLLEHKANLKKPLRKTAPAPKLSEEGWDELIAQSSPKTAAYFRRIKKLVKDREAKK